MPPSIKFCLGIIQSWIMTELCLRIWGTLRVSSAYMVRDPQAQEIILLETDKIIRIGRYIIIGVTVLFSLFAIAYCSKIMHD